MGHVARAVSFTLGVVILITEITVADCVRTPVIVAALLLMGVVSVDQLRDLIISRRDRTDQ